MKIQKKNWGGGGGVRVNVIKELKVFWENSPKKKIGGGGGGGGGVRLDVNEELKFLGKFTTKKWGGGGGGSGWM